MQDQIYHESDNHTNQYASSIAHPTEHALRTPEAFTAQT